MKKLTLLLIASLLLSSCTESHKSVAENFTENLAKGKVDEAKKYATESTGKMLDFASSFGGLPVDPNFSFEAESDSVSGNEAWVTYKKPDGRKETLDLVKIDGKWLVNMKSKK